MTEEVTMEIEAGWRFQSADFSVQASGKDSATGIVTLVRAPAEKARWHQMPEDLKEADNGPPLYMIGHGITIEDAIASANIAAAHAKPIPDAVVEVIGADGRQKQQASEAEPMADECAAEIERLQGLLRWAYSKLHGCTFSNMDDALKLDDIKLLLMG